MRALGFVVAVFLLCEAQMPTCLLGKCEALHEALLARLSAACVFDRDSCQVEVTAQLEALVPVDADTVYARLDAETPVVLSMAELMSVVVEESMDRMILFVTTATSRDNKARVSGSISVLQANVSASTVDPNCIGSNWALVLPHGFVEGCKKGAAAITRYEDLTTRLWHSARQSRFYLQRAQAVCDSRECREVVDGHIARMDEILQQNAPFAYRASVNQRTCRESETEPSKMCLDQLLSDFLTTQNITTQHLSFEPLSSPEKAANASAFYSKAVADRLSCQNGWFRACDRQSSFTLSIGELRIRSQLSDDEIEKAIEKAMTNLAACWHSCGYFRRVIGMWGAEMRRRRSQFLQHLVALRQTCTTQRCLSIVDARMLSEAKGTARAAMQQNIGNVYQIDRALTVPSIIWSGLVLFAGILFIAILIRRKLMHARMFVVLVCGIVIFAVLNLAYFSLTTVGVVYAATFDNNNIGTYLDSAFVFTKAAPILILTVLSLTLLTLLFQFLVAIHFDLFPAPFKYFNATLAITCLFCAAAMLGSCIYGIVLLKQGESVYEGVDKIQTCAVASFNSLIMVVFVCYSFLAMRAERLKDDKFQMLTLTRVALVGVLLFCAFALFFIFTVFQFDSVSIRPPLWAGFAIGVVMPYCLASCGLILFVANALFSKNSNQKLSVSNTPLLESDHDAIPLQYRE